MNEWNEMGKNERMINRLIDGLAKLAHVRTSRAHARTHRNFACGTRLVFTNASGAVMSAAKLKCVQTPGHVKLMPKQNP